MKVFKFGGGVLNSSDTVKKLPGIIEKYYGEPLVIVVSALGKTTNALEEVISACFSKTVQPEELLKKLIDHHQEIMQGLFPQLTDPVYKHTRGFWDELRFLLSHGPEAYSPGFYDNIICFGELISSVIVSHALAGAGYGNFWVDARTIIKTDSTFRAASVDWEASFAQAETEIKPILVENKSPVIVTQGFIGSNKQDITTTLGREGSDYTASIFASLLDADEVVIWKDVPGILNADPKHFRQTVKLDRISYAEATELAYYGAKVLHPKTIKPLQNKKIPLQVRSFIKPEEPGTLINSGTESDTTVPNFIFKFNQVLISVSTRDLSFINEKVFNDVFSLLSRFSIHVNIIQNSALTLSFCIDDHPKFRELMNSLQENYNVRYNQELELITIRHFNKKAMEMVLKGKEILLEQQNRAVVQYVVR